MGREAMLPVLAALPCEMDPISLHDVVDKMPVATFVTSTDRRVVLWNREAERMFGWRADEVVGRPPPIIPPGRIDEVNALSKRVRAGETIRGFQTLRRHRSGADVWVSLQLAPMNGGALVTYIDITDQRALNVALAASKRQLRAQNEELARVQREKQELVSLIVHDLKSPLAAILANVRFVGREPVLSEDGREALDDAQTCGDSLQRMLLNVLDVSRSEGADLTVRRQPIELESLVTSVCTAMRARLRENWQRIETSLVPVTIHADPELLRRVLENILDNSMKYGGSGALLTVTTHVEEKCVRVEIADPGPGIPASMRHQIFERNVRLDRDLANHARTSRGLGLTFCRLAVEAHGGTVHVEDNEPRGARFVVRLPR